MLNRNQVGNLSNSILPFSNSPQDYACLLKAIGDARLVFIGEASHGTHEFYKIRAELTKYLVTEKGFNAIALEGDWPNVYHINKYVKNFNGSTNGYEALRTFERFPVWMWSNKDVLEFIEWLRNYNNQESINRPRVGMYGLDLYSLHSSIDSVIHYLESIDPSAAQLARNRYECFHQYRLDPIRYAYDVKKGMSCKQQAQEQLKDLLHISVKLSSPDKDREELFSAVQNAKLVVNAEAYYGALLRHPDRTWNLRDTHMMETLDALQEFYYSLLDFSPKIVIWAHNSHIGDARATDSAKRGEINIGQLARERYGDSCYLIGFSTYQGEVTAASNWGGVAERKKVRPALKESYEYLFHHLDVPNFLLFPGEEICLERPCLQRAIGVIYRPETERQSHYYYASVLKQFNALIHIDQTSAVQPLFKTHTWEQGEFPETFPTGF